jgi:hypothetical protein
MAGPPAVIVPKLPVTSMRSIFPSPPVWLTSAIHTVDPRTARVFTLAARMTPIAPLASRSPLKSPAASTN